MPTCNKSAPIRRGRLALPDAVPVVGPPLDNDQNADERGSRPGLVCVVAPLATKPQTRSAGFPRSSAKWS
jgi:hypothetical protein